MKRYTIKINNNNTNNGSFNNNASKNLDNLILSNLIKMNPYLGYKKKSTSFLDAAFAEAGLNGGDDRIIIDNRFDGYSLKDTDFTRAAKFLSNYTPTKTYYKINRDDIAFFEDEIQIGDTLIPLYKLESPTYYSEFTPRIKNIIINLYITIKG